MSGVDRDPLEVAAGQLVLAADEVLSLGALNERYVKLTELALESFGRENIAEHVVGAGPPRLFVAVQVAAEGKLYPGALILFDDRVVVSWVEGALRPRRYAETVPLADIAQVTPFRHKPGVLSGECDAVAFDAGGWQAEVVFYSPVTHPRLAFLVTGILTGAVTIGPDTDLRRQADGPGDLVADGSSDHLRTGRSDFRVLALLEHDAPVTDHYPTPGRETDTVEPEAEDGDEAVTVAATEFTLSSWEDESLYEELDVGGVHALVTATACRLTFACSRYAADHGGGLGDDLAAMATHAAMRHGTMLVGHVRYPWLEAVLFDAKRSALRLIMTDPLGDVPLIADVALDRSTDVATFATDIAVLAAVHLLETDPAMPATEVRELDALVDEPLPRPSVLSPYQGFELTPGRGWVYRSPEPAATGSVRTALADRRGPRKARAGITIEAAMPPGELLTLAEQVAVETHARTWNMNPNVRMTPVARSDGVVQMAIGNRKTILTFYIEVTAAEGGAVLETTIGSARTQQTVAIGFIPAGPKRLIGYPYYKQFMVNLEAVVQARDPQAECTIVE